MRWIAARDGNAKAVIEAPSAALDKVLCRVGLRALKARS